MKYLDMASVQAQRHTDPPRTRQRQAGYGSKLPTSRQLRIANRWHRVYAVCWGTGQTCYIVKGGECLYIATGELS